LAAGQAEDFKVKAWRNTERFAMLTRRSARREYVMLTSLFITGNCHAGHFQMP
jgi:hypothetical protein